MTRFLPRIARDVPKGQRKPREGLRSKHRQWVKTLPCVACGGMPCDPAHVRMSRADLGKFNTGGRKPDDKYIVPLCRRCHDRQHDKEAERPFWARLGIDPVDVSLRLWAITGDTEQALRAIERAHQAIALHHTARANELRAGS